MMRTGHNVIGLVVTAVLLVAAYDLGRRRAESSPVPLVLPLPKTVGSSPPALVHRDAGPTIEQVRRLESLVVQRVDVADVCSTDVQGYLGGARAAILVRGDLVVAVDLGKARLEAKDAEKRSATLVLPQPAVSRPRLDQEKTRLVELDRQGLWTIVPGDGGRSAAVNHGYRHAQQVVAAAGTDPRLIQSARSHAEQTLGAFFQALGWSVTIRWEPG